MIADLLTRAAELSVAWWFCTGALYLLTACALLLFLARWGDDFDRRRER